MINKKIARIKEYNKRYREKNKDYFKTYSKKYRLKNKEKLDKYLKLWKDAHRKELIEYLKEYHKRWYLKNKDSVLIHHREYKNKKYREDKAFREKSLLRVNSKNLGNNITGLNCCMICGTFKDLHKHHPSYKSYDYLVLCSQHHNNLHYHNGSLWFENQEKKVKT